MKAKALNILRENVTDDMSQMSRLSRDDVTADLWTPETVASALVWALKLVTRVGGSTGPKAFGNAMPRHLYEWADIVGWVTEEGEFTGRTAPARIGATAEQVTRMEAVLRWQGQYLAGQPGPGRVLKLWLRAKVTRSHFNKTMKRHGWSPRTAYRARDRALALIAVGLNRDGVKVWRTGE